MKNWIQDYKLQLILIGLMLIALWPLSLLMYTTKWDNIDCFLSFRYFVSYSFWQGEWPLWNPFQQLGYPAYSDTQNGMYSPVTWILMFFGEYNSISLSIELLLYYCIGIVGAYKFAALFVKNSHSQFFVAIAYGFSGFMMGNSQIISFIAGAAFLPHILFQIINFFHTNKWKPLLLFVLFTALHVTIASPAYSIILVYILTGVFIYHGVKNIQVKWSNFSWLKLLLAGVFIFLLILPFANSIWEFLPFMKRAQRLAFDAYSLQNPFDWHEWISFLFPYSTLSNSEWFGNTDLTMRSAYIGVLPLIFIILSLKFWKELKIKILWLGVIGTLIIAAGAHTPIYQYVYQLPGFGFFRHPALFRIYTILLLSVLAGIGFDRWELKTNKALKIGLLVVISLFIAVLAGSLYHPFTEDIKSYFSYWERNIEPIRHYLRTYLFLNTILILPLLILAYFAIGKEKAKTYVLLLCVADVLIYTQITATQTIHLHTTQESFLQYFKALPDTINQTCATIPYKLLNENYEPKQQGVWRNVATFHKSLTFDAANPTQFLNFNTIEDNGGMEITKENPLFYDINKKVNISNNNIVEPNLMWDWQGGTTPEINPNSLQIISPQIGFNKFNVRVKNTSTKNDILVLNQNYHQLWKAKLNGQELEITRINQALMGVIIPANSENVVEFIFDSPNTKVLFVSSVIFYILLLAGIFYTVSRNK